MYKVSKKKISLIIIILVVVSAFLFLRSTYVSNRLKMAILSEVQQATGRQVIAQKIYINLIPLYVEAREVRAFDKDGARFFSAARVKAYIDVFGLLDRRLVMNRIVLIKPEVWANRAQMDEVLGNLKKNNKGEAPPRVELQAVVIKDGSMSFHDEVSDTLLLAGGADVEVFLGKAREVRFSVKDISATVRDWPELKGSARGNAVLRDGRVELKGVEVSSLGSSLKGKGTYEGAFKGTFSLGARLVISTLKQVLGFETPGDGELNARGTVSLQGELGNTGLDLEVDGNLYLETLMALVGAPPKLTGFANFEGKIDGTVSDLRAQGRAWMDSGSFYGIEVEKAACKVIYGDGVLRFADGDARLYGGTGTVDVTLRIPGVRPYSVRADYSGVEAASALKLIGLEKLHLAPGTVEGTLYTEGHDFHPAGSVLYTARETGGDPFKRIRQIRGTYNVNGDTVTLTDFEALSEASRLAFAGSVNKESDEINFSGDLRTRDVNELLDPYFTRLRAEGTFSGVVTGTTADPLVSGGLALYDTSLDSYRFGDVTGRISYRKNLLEISSLASATGPERMEARGAIRFPEAEGILDELDNGIYDIEASIKEARLLNVLKLLGAGVDADGSLKSTLSLSGRGMKPEVKGAASVTGASLYGYPVSEADFGYSYRPGRFEVRDAVLKQGASTVSLKGSLTGKQEFEFSASSGGILLSDVVAEKVPFNVMFSLKAEGRGTFEQPEVRAAATILSSELKGVPVGGGTFKGTLTGREAVFSASLLDGKVRVDGGADLSRDLPWTAELQIDQGRYNFLISPFLKAPPDDLAFSLSGKASLYGTRNRFGASFLFDNLSVHLYGQGFSNLSDVKLSMENKRVSIADFKVRGGNTLMSIGGDIDLGESYDVVVEGSTSLSPLSAFYEQIDTLRGDSEYVFSVRGPWESPQIDGGMSLSNGFLALKNKPQRLSAIKGYFYISGDRAVVENLEATIGGGSVKVAGVVQLKGFSVEQILLDATLNNVTYTVSRNFSVNLGGNLFFRGTANSQIIAGDVRINRATYRERIEWKSWLLELRKREAPVAQRPWASKVGLNIKVSGKEDIVLDNNIARTSLELDLIVRGTLAEPRFFGRIDAVGGKVFFRNGEFRILNATALYSDSKYTDPFITVAAEASSQGYNVTLNLQGKIEQLDMALSSDPPLGNEEILGLLALGQPGRGLTGLEGGIGAAEATSFLTGRIQDVFEERLTDLTGLDRVTVDPYVSKSTGTVTPRVTVGKRLMSDKLFVTYSTTGEEQVLRLEYLLGPNVSLLGGQDEQGSIGGDIKFRFHFE